ncbi:MAG: hypothetical protein MJY90_00230 [Bacteroidaceae bacterium]|nr:hypothetical protein [Bacteroidaceae bacterium]
MLRNLQRQNLSKHLLVGGALLVASLGFYSCSDEALDRENDQPSGLNSLFGYVESEGNFTNFVQLIQDLGEQEVLSKTGSKTLFVADDDAFAEFFKSNPWGVRSYSELSMAQKKLLLYSAMIDNPYPTTLLSSAQPGSTTGGPVPGEVFRRVSSQSVLDSVAVITSSDYDATLPKNKYFSAITGLDTIVLFEDATAPPMVHFNGKFLQGNKLSTNDVDFLYGVPDGTFHSDDVYVNNARVKVAEGKANIFCLNGFIHEVDKVILPLDNMAKIIASNPKSTYYSSILDRFAAPQDSAAVTRAYAGNSRAENVFVKRYFSQRSYGSTVSAGSSSDVAFTTDKDGNIFDAKENLLKFDPGWNAFVSNVSNPRTALMEDMAVMLAPTDEAIDKWWNEGDGRVIKNYYAKYATEPGMIGELNTVPTSVIAKLVNVNMFNSFVGTLPTNFKDVLDDANEKIGLSRDSIENVVLGCNGAVYFTKNVFAPKSYSSVLFPVVVDTTQMKVINNAIMTMDYDKYLNSMVAKYRFVIPSNKGMLTYIDPVSYGQSTPNLWQFRFDETAKNIVADVYECTLNDDGSAVAGKYIVTLKNGTNNGIIFNRMNDLLDNIIAIGDSIPVPGKKYYKTKGNNFIKFDGTDVDNPENPTATTIQASWQQEHGTELVPHQIFKMKNGYAYVADGIAMGTTKSVAQMLNENDDFSDFLKLLQYCGAVSTQAPTSVKQDNKDFMPAANQTFGNLLHVDTKSISYLLNNYHYTIYVPTNQALAEAFADGLPTFDMVDAAEALDEEEGGTFHADSLKAIMLDFVKYHIQDNSIYVDAGFESGNYESGKTKLHPAIDEEGNILDSYTPGRPYKINVNSSATALSVTDEAGRKADVITRDGYHNLMAREWWLIDDNSKREIKRAYECKIDNSSSAVIHAVNHPLYYCFEKDPATGKPSTDPDKNQFIYKDRALTSASGIKNTIYRK